MKEWAMVEAHGAMKGTEVCISLFPLVRGNREMLP